MFGQVIALFFSSSEALPRGQHKNLRKKNNLSTCDFVLWIAKMFGTPQAKAISWQTNMDSTLHSSKASINNWKKRFHSYIHIIYDLVVAKTNDVTPLKEILR